MSDMGCGRERTGGGPTIYQDLSLGLFADPIKSSQQSCEVVNVTILLILQLRKLRAATWMYLEMITLSAVSQKEKDKYCNINAYIWNLEGWT